MAEITLPDWLQRDIAQTTPPNGHVAWAMVSFANPEIEAMIGPSQSAAGNPIYVIGYFIPEPEQAPT